MLRSISSLLVALSITFCITAKAKAEDEDLPPDLWPLNVADTVNDILARLEPEARAKVKHTKRDELILYHHGWGTGIRNYYGLWRGNQKLIASACGKPCHPDDASIIIIDAVWAELQK